MDISPKAGVDVIWPTFLQGEIGNEARCYPLTHYTNQSMNHVSQNNKAGVDVLQSHPLC